MERLKYYQDGFHHLQMAPPDPILGTALAFKACQAKDKINLGIGAFRDDYSNPYVFKVVRKAEEELFKENLDKEYLPIEGFAPFNEAAQKLLFGAENELVKKGCITTVQCLSGTGALRVGFEFLGTHLKGSGEVLVSDPTWGNHIQIIQKSGFKVKYYPYWDDATKGLNINGVLKTIQEAQPKSIILLHVCAHNPTGVDPTPEQWEQIGLALKEKQIFPFFDSAYQGFASGDLKKDAIALEIFQKLDLQFCVSQSFAKNMGMYGERIGAMHFVCKSKQVADILLSQIKLTIRPMYSSPPIWGAKIVAKVLGNPETAQKWEKELKEVALQIITRRDLLKKYLVQYKAKGTWDHITNQIGMFSYTGLNQAQCELLINKHNIFLVKNGRISMAGVTTHNVKKLSQAIADVLIQTDPEIQNLSKI